MPTINPSLVPTVAPGNLFDALTTDDTLNIRWLVAQDPVHYEVYNRPLADAVVRQLILAKAVDQLELSVGHMSLFPFLIQPQVSSGSEEYDLPGNWIWDMNLSLPQKWENLRLAKIKRISGANDGSGGYTGKLRLIFTATEENASTETAVAYADCTIDSATTYEIVRIETPDDEEEAVVIDSGEADTVTGFIIFRTLDVDDATVEAFLDAVAPPDDTTDSNSDGLFDDPAVYELVDSVPGDSSGDFQSTTLSHGTGLLTANSWNPIPALDSDIQSWISAFNYPFDATANLTSTSGVVMPAGMFREFDITAPAGDEPSGDTSGTFYPVWISRIERVNETADLLRFYFATYNITDEANGGSPSTETVEFATMDLENTMAVGEIVEIVPLANLLLQDGDDASSFIQHFGRGHVVLSSIWGETSSAVDDFFSEFSDISNDPADIEFSKTSTRLASFGISRVPKYAPTIGQGHALAGSSARFTTPINPSDDNRFVTEQDQGIGNTVDLEAETDIDPHVAIERLAYSGSLCHRAVMMIVDSSQVETGDNTFYDDVVLPRLRVLFGRDPVFGDVWYNGTRFLTYNNKTWVG